MQVLEIEWEQEVACYNNILSVWISKVNMSVESVLRPSLPVRVFSLKNRVPYTPGAALTSFHTIRYWEGVIKEKCETLLGGIPYFPWKKCGRRIVPAEFEGGATAFEKTLPKKGRNRCKLG